jgi:hypothetical protein
MNICDVSPRRFMDTRFVVVEEQEEDAHFSD